MCEFGSYHTTVAVWSGDLAPDASDLCTLSFSGGSVDECYSLSKVELCGLCIIDTLNLQQRCVGIGVSLASLVRQVLAFDV